MHHCWASMPVCANVDSGPLSVFFQFIVVDKMCNVMRIMLNTTTNLYFSFFLFAISAVNSCRLSLMLVQTLLNMVYGIGCFASGCLSHKTLTITAKSQEILFYVLPMWNFKHQLSFTVDWYRWLHSLITSRLPMLPFPSY